jgi:hypothetical protein
MAKRTKKSAAITAFGRQARRFRHQSEAFVERLTEDLQRALAAAGEQGATYDDLHESLVEIANGLETLASLAQPLTSLCTTGGVIETARAEVQKLLAQVRTEMILREELLRGPCTCPECTAARRASPTASGGLN